ncbi:class I SAM-dependent methyltransferase [soil metagenome]
MSRGSEAYEDESVRTIYLAHRHSGVASPNVVMEEPAFLAAVGSLTGTQVADLGCGDGATARTIMELGAATYLGLDGSAGMIDAARDRHAMPGVTFVHQDIEDLSLATRAFDLVTSRMAFHYIESLGPVLDCIGAGLRSGGRLVFTVTHPVITSHDSASPGQRTNWTVDDYFVRAPRLRPWFGSDVIWHHRTIGDYVRLITEHGLRLDLIDECEPDAALLEDHSEELQRRRRVPLVLLVAASRP